MLKRYGIFKLNLISRFLTKAKQSKAKKFWWKCRPQPPNYIEHNLCKMHIIDQNY